MRIISKKILVDFTKKHPDSANAIGEFWLQLKTADWATPQDIKNTYPKASIVADNRAIFNICGGRYRIIIKFNYPYRAGWVRFIGTHSDYDKIDVKNI